MEPSSDRHEYEVHDPRAVERMLAEPASSERLAFSRLGPARTVVHRCADTAQGRLLRAGHALALTGSARRGRAELGPLGAAGRVFAEDAVPAVPSAIARSGGPVGRRVRLLAGRAPLRELVALRVRE